VVTVDAIQSFVVRQQENALVDRKVGLPLVSVRKRSPWVLCIESESPLNLIKIGCRCVCNCNQNVATGQVCDDETHRSSALRRAEERNNQNRASCQTDSEPTSPMLVNNSSHSSLWLSAFMLFSASARPQSSLPETHPKQQQRITADLWAFYAVSLRKAIRKWKYQHVAGVLSGKLLLTFKGVVPSPKRKRKIILRHRKLIGEAIRRYRKRESFTQERLAELADLNPKYLGEIERGEKIISIEALLRISKSLKIQIRDFFRGV
jgi:DNA-binding XRE family transcriptional regulator